jgi:hypothetical protein
VTINNFKTINDFLEEKKVKSNFFSQEINLFLDFLSKKTKSSYKVNNFGKIFIYLSYHLKPKIIYELGVLGCYSLLSIGYGQKLLNKEKNKYTKSYGYDLFEDYKYNSFKLHDAEELVRTASLNNYISLEKVNIFENNFIEKIDHSDFLHIDLSNDGHILKTIFSDLSLDIKRTIIIEGGGNDRERVEWMQKYGKKSILNFLIELDSKHNINIDIIQEFPSVSILTFN